MSVILTDQDDGAALPTYGRNDTVKGILHLKDTKDVTRVSVKVSQSLAHGFRALSGY